MTDMIERVAWKMLANCPRHIYDDLAYRGTAKILARAAIAAMRDCTPEMLDAGSAAHPAGGSTRWTLLNDIIECEWVAMCDAALECSTKQTEK